MIEAFKLLGKISFDGSEEARKKLDKLRKKVEEVGDKFKDFGDKVKGAGEKLATSVGAPLAAFGTAAAVTAAQVNDSAAEIQQELGLTAEEASKLNKTAQDLWAQGFGEDLASVSTRVAGVTRALGDLNEADLSTVTKGIDLIERRGWGDQEEALKTIDVLMKDFGFTAEEATDHITAGFQQGLNYSGEFLDVISEYGTYFDEMGFSGKQMFDFLASGAAGNAFQLDKVGVAMQEFTFRAKDSGESTKEAFSGLGLNANEMIKAFNEGGESGKAAFEKTIKALQGVENETKRNELATALFGTGYEDLGEKAFDAMLTASESLENVEGATDRANDAFEETFSTELRKTIRELQLGLAPLGGVILDIAQRYLPPLLEKIQSLVKWFQNLSEKQQDLVVYIGAFLVVLGPLLIILGSITRAVGFLFKPFTKLMPILGQVWKLFKGLRLVLLFFTGPIGLIILAVTGLIAIGIALYKNWDAVVAWLSETWTYMVEYAKAEFERTKQAVVDTFVGIWNGIVGIWNAIILWLSETWAYLYNYAVAEFERTKVAIITPFLVAWAWIKETWTFIKDWIVSKAQEIWSNVTTKFNEIKTAITTAITNAKDLVVEKFVNMKDTIWEKINKIWTDIKTIFGNIKDAIWEPIEEAKEKVGEFIEEILGFLDFDWEIPKPKVPKISLKWGEKTFFGMPIKYPTGFDVQWAARGGILDRTTLIGAGEAGKEMLMPLEGDHFKPVAKMIADNINMLGGGRGGTIEIPILVNGRELARAVVNDLDKEIERQRTIRKRGL